jgi:hypothetical protein
MRARAMEAIMAAEKYTFDQTFDFGTISYKTVVNQTKNGYILTDKYKIDYNENYEALGFIDEQVHTNANQNVYNSILRVGDDKYHFHYNYHQWMLLD